jgi:hypothetical protein
MDISLIAYVDFLKYSLGIIVVVKDLPKSCGGSHKRRNVARCSGLLAFFYGMTQTMYLLSLMRLNPLMLGLV